METNELNPIQGKEVIAMELSAESVVYLNETRKWTIFLSILGFIFIGLMVVASLFMGVIFGSISNDVAISGAASMGMGVAYILIAILYFFPIFYLYKFSNYSKNAIENKDSNVLNLAFKNLKSHYKFMGILTIIILSIYLLAFLIMAIVGGIGML
ncbi:DUF5362 family protein [Ancylomarina longa]|uniref:DUF5362 domain-containing protein n=1 Tax=Ancylomarina longa TaxID=2487017 RepID=A0A434AVU2_9BACT|nr:DUF5362 family protein [Ancylomarina longa]RUT78616.1 hypothetical protein DLK05_07185 [Ancylomarina longa]